MFIRRLLMSVITASACATSQADDFDISGNVKTVIERYCAECHGGGSAEGNVQLDALSRLDHDERLELLNKAQEQLFFRRMPPDDAEQPTDSDHQALAEMLASELKRFGASKLEEKLRRPEYGNYVDHDELFSGRITHPRGFTYDRRWLISEFIFNAKFNRILNHKPTLNIDGKRQSVIGSNNRRVNLTNPFLLPSNAGVRYYANETLNGGHLLTMLTNAKESATYMLYLAGRDNRYLPAINAMMASRVNKIRSRRLNKAFNCRRKFRSGIPSLTPMPSKNKRTRLLANANFASMTARQPFARDSAHRHADGRRWSRASRPATQGAACCSGTADGPTPRSLPHALGSCGHSTRKPYTESISVRAS